ncbi:MAG TPA: hypothetical protein LFW21_04575 [Rickettsia endosymbiont of Pyrocoelia pectoralis]|nr:hypothetical protein [Rickettsia endosymbiont of Pyrocoelia pectoralis]
MPEHFEKVINLISPDKLKKLFDTNAGGITLDELMEEELNKLSDKNTSDEKIKDIITLVGEEDLVKHITKSSNFIPSENLETIFANISSENGIEILKFLENSSELLGAAAAA